MPELHAPGDRAISPGDGGWPCRADSKSAALAWKPIDSQSRRAVFAQSTGGPERDVAACGGRGFAHGPTAAAGSGRPSARGHSRAPGRFTASGNPSLASLASASSENGETGLARRAAADRRDEADARSRAIRRRRPSQAGRGNKASEIHNADGQARPFVR